MNNIQVIPLGAGQDVGRSCILVSLNGKNIMFDCGMHMGYNDDVDCVIISHFHLDHCGALPYMSEMVGFSGPIFMTYPTKAIAPILLEDFRKITVERKGDQNFFTTEMIFKAMSKVQTVSLHEIVKVDEGLEIQPFYAGHVLGAAMFRVRAGNKSVVYTGDYNMTPDRHLGAASIDPCEPDLLITETTYATTIRDSKRTREQEFLDNIYHIVENGGKVLIPVFALGRAQELCILLESYWERKNMTVPIYFSTGMAEKANEYYRLFISWTNQKIKEVFVERNMFDFKHIKPLLPGFVDNPGPMVIFATPGMLNAGQSLNIFRKWAPDPKNAVIIPGYCVSGTILNGVKKLDFEGQTVDVKIQVQYLSFSAHADARGIMQLITQCQPKNVLLVHGEASKMEFLRGRIMKEFNVPCFMPANGEVANIPINSDIYAECPLELVERKAVNLKRNLIRVRNNEVEVNREYIASLGLMVNASAETYSGIIMEQNELITKSSLQLLNLFSTLSHIHSYDETRTSNESLMNIVSNLILKACGNQNMDVKVEKCEDKKSEARYDLNPTSISIAMQFLQESKTTPINHIPIYCTFLDRDESAAVKIFNMLKTNLEKMT